MIEELTIPYDDYQSMYQLAPKLMMLMIKEGVEVHFFSFLVLSPVLFCAMEGIPDGNSYSCRSFPLRCKTYDRKKDVGPSHLDASRVPNENSGRRLDRNRSPRTGCDVHRSTTERKVGDSSHSFLWRLIDCILKIHLPQFRCESSAGIAEEEVTKVLEVSSRICTRPIIRTSSFCFQARFLLCVSKISFPFLAMMNLLLWTQLVGVYGFCVEAQGCYHCPCGIY